MRLMTWAASVPDVPVHAPENRLAAISISAMTSSERMSSLIVGDREVLRRLVGMPRPDLGDSTGQVGDRL